MRLLNVVFESPVPLRGSAMSSVGEAEYDPATRLVTFETLDGPKVTPISNVRIANVAGLEKPEKPEKPASPDPAPGPTNAIVTPKRRKVVS